MGFVFTFFVPFIGPADKYIPEYSGKLVDKILSQRIKLIDDEYYRFLKVFLCKKGPYIPDLFYGRKLFFKGFPHFLNKYV